MLRPALIWLSQQQWAEQGVRAVGGERLLVRRFVAGDTAADALAAAMALDGSTASLALLGEAVSDPADAERAAAEYGSLLAAIAEAPDLSDLSEQPKLDVRVAVKPTLLGLDISRAVAERGLLQIVETAAAHGVWVEIDMEGSATVDATLDLYRAAAARSERTAVALQAYLRRTPQDAQALIDDGIARVRLVKGAYSEPNRIAYRSGDAVRRAYAALLEQLWSAGASVGVATHDPALHRAARRLTAQPAAQLTDQQPGAGEWEFQMLYGVRPQLGADMRRRGERLRISIPYGPDWYPYLMRRIAERPSNALFALRALIGR